jgi:signal transduction histidine kinase
MARELHDVVSHAIGVMVLQAGAADALRESDPVAAREAVRTIETTGARATSELEVLLGLVDGGAVGAASSPLPQDEGLSSLVDRMRASGLSIELDGGELPGDDTVRRTAYRVVQEALTNAARHAPGATVTVRTRTGDGWLSVEVENGPGLTAGSPPELVADGGYGLVGLAERVRALGGELAAGPTPGDGFVVAGRLPVPQQAVLP